MNMTIEEFKKEAERLLLEYVARAGDLRMLMEDLDDASREGKDYQDAYCHMSAVYHLQLMESRHSENLQESERKLYKTVIGK